MGLDPRCSHLRRQLDPAWIPEAGKNGLQARPVEVGSLDTPGMQVCEVEFSRCGIDDNALGCLRCTPAGRRSPAPIRPDILPGYRRHRQCRNHHRHMAPHSGRWCSRTRNRRNRRCRDSDHRKTTTPPGHTSPPHRDRPGWGNRVSREYRGNEALIQYRQSALLHGLEFQFNYPHTRHDGGNQTTPSLILRQSCGWHAHLTQPDRLPGRRQGGPPRNSWTKRPLDPYLTSKERNWRFNWHASVPLVK